MLAKLVSWVVDSRFNNVGGISCYVIQRPNRSGLERIRKDSAVRIERDSIAEKPFLTPRKYLCLQR
jgi:hypothetical protein